jgi:hypothetical protein
MRIAISSALDFERAFFDEANQSLHHDLVYYRERLHERPRGCLRRSSPTTYLRV